jgi:hypothetical protein
MNRSESITHLATALAKAQAEMPVAVFDASNPFLKNKYASLGAVIQASRPILAKHRLSLVQFPISALDGTKGTEGTNGSRVGADYIGVESILMHESGEFMTERILVALTEEKGKSRVQCAGSTLTYLRRYSWASILGMYSDEDSDGSSPVQAFTMRTIPPLPPPPMRALN